MDDLTRHAATYDHALTEWRHAEVLAALRQSTGLAYRSLAPVGEHHGPFVVAVDGMLVGDVRFFGPGVLNGWTAHAARNGELAPDDDPGTGPHATVRAAATSLIPKGGVHSMPV